MDFEAYVDSNDFNSSKNRPGTPEKLIETATTATKKLLPAKSKTRYEQVYENFQQWKKLKGATSNSERVLLAYFTELVDNKNVSSTLWLKYSMLRTTLKINDKTDISTYGSLNALLKQAPKGHVKEQAKIFTEDEIKHFIDTAHDVAWLDVKVVCAFGLSGACRTHELTAITMQHIVHYADMYFITIPKEFTKTGDKDNRRQYTGTLEKNLHFINATI